MSAGVAAFRRLDYAKAAQAFENALVEAERFGPDGPRVAITLHRLGVVYGAAGRFTVAERVYLRSLSISERLAESREASPAANPELARTFSAQAAATLNNLGEIYHAQGKLAQAEPLFLRAVAVATKAFGSEHPNSAMPLHNVGALYYNQGRHEEAELYFQQALRALRTMPDSPDVAIFLRNYARLLRALSRDDEAARLEEQALTVGGVGSATGVTPKH